MKTDIAALSASVVAVSVAIFGPPGYYDALGVALSLTVVFLFFGYVFGEHRKGRMQGIAISSVFGLAVLPIIGFAYEKLILGAPCDPHCYMPQEAHFAFWCAASFAAYFLDQSVERRPKVDG